MASSKYSGFLKSHLRHSFKEDLLLDLFKATARKLPFSTINFIRA
jgi:hypothetical protein